MNWEAFTASLGGIGAFLCLIVAFLLLVAERVGWAVISAVACAVLFAIAVGMAA